MKNNKTSDSQLLATLDAKILPVMFWMVLTGYMYRTGMSLVYESLVNALNFSNFDFALVSAFYYIPFTLVLTISLHKLDIVGVWCFPTILGLIASLNATIPFALSFERLLLVRLLQGSIEGLFFPCILAYLQNFYCYEEINERLGNISNGAVFGIFVSGPIAYVFNLEGFFGFHGWQWFFFVMFFPTVGVAGYALRNLPNPADTDNQREIMLKEKEIFRSPFDWKEIKRILFPGNKLDQKRHVLTIIYVMTTVSNVYFSSAIITSFGFSECSAIFFRVMQSVVYILIDMFTEQFVAYVGSSHSVACLGMIIASQSYCWIILATYYRHPLLAAIMLVPTGFNRLLLLLTHKDTENFTKNLINAQYTARSIIVGTASVAAPFMYAFSAPFVFDRTPEAYIMGNWCMLCLNLFGLMIVIKSMPVKQH